MSGSSRNGTSSGFVAAMIGAPWALFALAALLGPEAALIGLLVLGAVILGVYSLRPPRREEILAPGPMELAAEEPRPLEIMAGAPMEAATTTDATTCPAPLAEALGIAAPSGSEADRHLAEAVRAAAADLPEAERVSLIGYYLEARSIQELSALLDCNESQVVANISDALDVIRPTTEDVDDETPLSA